MDIGQVPLAVSNLPLLESVAQIKRTDTTQMNSAMLQLKSLFPDLDEKDRRAALERSRWDVSEAFDSLSQAVQNNELSYNSSSKKKTLKQNQQDPPPRFSGRSRQPYNPRSRPTGGVFNSYVPQHQDRPLLEDQHIERQPLERPPPEKQPLERPPPEKQTPEHPRQERLSQQPRTPQSKNKSDQKLDSKSDTQTTPTTHRIKEYVEVINVVKDDPDVFRVPAFNPWSEEGKRIMQEEERKKKEKEEEEQRQKKIREELIQRQMKEEQERIEKERRIKEENDKKEKEENERKIQLERERQQQIQIQ
ncbi:MAG: hypothetical protein EZS28_033104, partial [Streblomastix strix]